LIPLLETSAGKLLPLPLQAHETRFIESITENVGWELTPGHESQINPLLRFLHEEGIHHQEFRLRRIWQIAAPAGLMVWDEGQLVGVALFRGQISLTAMRPQPFLVQLAVAATHRRMGIGGLLVNIGMESFRSLGYRYMTLIAEEGSAGAHLYRGLGFSLISRIPGRRPQTLLIRDLA